MCSLVGDKIRFDFNSKIMWNDSSVIFSVSFFVSTVSRSKLYGGFDRKVFCCFSTVIGRELEQSSSTTKLLYLLLSVLKLAKNIYIYINDEETFSIRETTHFHERKKDVNKTFNKIFIGCRREERIRCKLQPLIKSDCKFPTIRQLLHRICIRHPETTKFKKCNFFVFPTLFKMLFLRLH